MSGTDPSPQIRVVRGRPDAEELAALTVVLLALAAAAHRRTGAGERRLWAVQEVPRRSRAAWRTATRWTA